jgi:iron complex outermembrane receptor protein
MVLRAYSRTLVAAVAGFHSLSLAAQSPQDSAATLKPVVVTVTRGSGRTVLGSPFAISITEPDSSRPGQRHVAIDETLALIPGVTSVSRSNPAQDPRLSIRGFGARSAFGVRGVRVLRDGMPITLPDGQTPLDYVSLESVGHIEVLRGAASALYGNASGGVVDLRSSDPSSAPIAVEGKQWIGSGALARTALLMSGSRGALRYISDAAYTKSNGPRDHSTQRAAVGFGRAATTIGKNEISLTVMGLANPLAENPGALTLEEMKADAGMADALSVRRNAKKSVNQIQIGAQALRQIRDGELSISAYGGARSLDNPLTFAVVEVERHSWGASGGVRARRSIARAVNSFAAGFDLQLQNDLRRNFAVCTDTIVATVPTATCPYPGNARGIVTLDQRETVSSAGFYVSDEVALSDRLSITAAVRGDRIRFEVNDRLRSNSNPDDSGARTLGAVSPVAGIVGRIGTTHSVYANVSAAFETPTATELGNHEDGSAGINPDLDPQRSVTTEGGARGWLGRVLRYDASLFSTHVRDELIAFEIPASNGRRYFRNAGRTLRRGAEAGGDISIHPVTVMLAYTWSRFRFEDYAASGVDFSGNTIPGISSQRLQSALRVDGRGAFLLFENETAGRAWLDDANTVKAPAYSVTSARLGWTAPRRHLSISTGIQNIFGRVYASSFAVNAARGKYFEPAPGRTFYVGLSLGSRRIEK